MEENLEIRFDEINWKIIFRDLRKNILLIIMAALIAFMCVGIYERVVYSPQYTSSATLSVSVRGSADSSSYFSLSTAKDMAEVYASVLEEKITKDKAAQAAAMDFGEARVAADVIPETNLILLKVTAGTPLLSFLTIKAILGNYQKVSDYLFENAVIEVIMRPQVPFAPSNSIQKGKLRKLGMLAGVAFMMGLIVMCTLFRQTAKNPLGARRHLEGECLAVFPHEIKNKTWKSWIQKRNKGIMLTNPVISFAFEEGCHRLASRLDYRMKNNGLKTLLVTSVAENEGKSTVAINLAIALARHNKKVVVLDADLMKPAIAKLTGFSVPKGKGMINYLEGEVSLEDVLLHSERSDVYSVLNTKPVSDSMKYLNSARFGQLLRTCRGIFDYVIIDTSPVWAETAAERLVGEVDASILVVRQDRVWTSDINDVIETLNGGKARFLGYVLNDFDQSYGRQRGYDGHGSSTEESKH